MRLKELRVKRKISQLKLAMDLGMNQNSISRYENETRQADYDTLIKLADYFGVSIDYLLERTDNPKMFSDTNRFRQNRMSIAFCQLLLEIRGITLENFKNRVSFTYNQVFIILDQVFDSFIISLVGVSFARTR